MLGQRESPPMNRNRDLAGVFTPGGPIVTGKGPPRVPDAGMADALIDRNPDYGGVVDAAGLRTFGWRPGPATTNLPGG